MSAYTLESFRGKVLVPEDVNRLLDEILFLKLLLRLSLSTNQKLRRKRKAER